ncbi:MAG: DNA repair protein RecO [Candidatus Kerfeldbacteria bacterium CG08_land_8_20_14_0_20_40_16]|uniref:DNA repair protein RecO n=1 Tax=Candidatus Kerfeldbacteria bacterium CG08_land_8_20_14_0_20_40_16 TaxID=2014244 RepID=A0A2H0YUR2_9BACT|nr:MAG: DNA repair protein RecO [Candidatus Kerfeldbacteria bacterium CG08_land_8_20_14_0_20_40_16]
MFTHHSSAFILKRQDFKEYDKLLTIYSEKEGKIEVVARGTRKIQSKLAGHLEPFALVDLMVAQGKYHDRVTGSTILKNFEHLKSNFERIALATYFNESVDHLTRLHQTDQQTFDLIKEAYSALDHYNQKREDDFKRQVLIVLSFLLRLLSLQGFQPSFKNCFYCQRGIKEEQNFISYSQLSIICPACRKNEDNLETISPTTLKVLRLMSQERFSSLKINNLDDLIFGEIREVVNKILQAVSEREIKSAKMIEDLV